MSGLPPRRRALLALAVVALAVVAARTFGDDPSVASPPDAAPAAAAPSTTVATTGSTRATIGVAPPSTLAPLLTTTSTAPFDPWSLRPPAPAADPGGLAAQIVAAETILRDAGAPEPAVAQAALAQQVAYRQLGLHPEWDGPVLAAVPPSLQLTVLRQAYARREFLAMHGRLAPEPPTGWRIVAPAPLDQLFADYQEAQQRTGIPWPYLAAVNLVETSLGRIQATSTAGALGPMQFLPATWARYGGGGDVLDVHDAILGAARYLAANNGVADLPGALWHYNHSAHYVNGVLIYAQLIAEHPLALRAFWYWGVWYRTASADVYLPVGYG
jgi:hypothetical protein